LNPDDLILMDKNYKDRIAYRKRIMAKHPKETLSVTDDARIAAAVREYYTWVTATYLPLRYPAMFKLHKTTYEMGEHFLLQNLLTNEMWPSFPLDPRTVKTEILLSILSKTLDEDILFLLPEENVPEGQEPKYVLHAYAVCCPSGFNPAEKIGKRLADIHGPVPGYSAKLEGSMDRYFAKLEVGKYVKRVNWSVTTDAELFSAGGGTVHAHEGDQVEELENINVDQVSTLSISPCLMAYIRRPSCDVSGRPCIVYPTLKPSYLLSRRTCTRSSRSEQKVWVRSWLKLLTA
jgi:hypothetical protein